MIIAMARERSIPSPTKKVQEVQEGQVPRESRRGRFLNRNYSQGRAFISDEELAVVANRTRTREPAQVRARGHSSASTVPSAVERLSTDVGCNQEAAFAAARALKNSTSEHKSQNESQAQAA